MAVTRIVRSRGLTVVGLGLLSSAATCPPPPPTADYKCAVSIQGPETLKNGGDFTPYTIAIGVGGKLPADSWSPSAPWYVREADGTYLTRSPSPSFPPGVNSATLTVNLRCTAAGFLAGDFANPNPPVSSHGSPAAIVVENAGALFDGTNGNIGAYTHIKCVP
jgi:hypothetical protein